MVILLDLQMDSSWPVVSQDPVRLDIVSDVNLGLGHRMLALEKPNQNTHTDK